MLLIISKHLSGGTSQSVHRAVCVSHEKQIFRRTAEEQEWTRTLFYNGLTTLMLPLWCSFSKRFLFELVQFLSSSFHYSKCRSVLLSNSPCCCCLAFSIVFLLCKLMLASNGEMGLSLTYTNYVGCYEHMEDNTGYWTHTIIFFV